MTAGIMPVALSPRDVLKHEIARHREAVARLEIVHAERRDAAAFAIDLLRDAGAELTEERRALADAIDALAAIKRAERRIA